MTRAEIAKSRVTQRRDHRGWYDKVFNLRRLTGGDLSALNVMEPQEASSTPGAIPAQAANLNSPEHYFIDVRTVAEGRSNHLLRALKTLVMQAAFKTPDVSLRGHSADVTGLTTAYLEKRLGPKPHGCDASNHMRYALWDALIGGIGWTGVTFQAGRPALMRYDSTKVVWDTSTTSLSDCRWVSVRDKRSLAEWVEVYGRETLQKWIEFDPGMTTAIELEFYYDLEGEAGYQAVFIATGESEVEPTPIIEGPNPFYYQEAGKRVPFLPLEPIYVFELPGVLYPESLVRTMLPHQIAIWETELQHRRILKTQKPVRVINRGVLSQGDKERMARGTPLEVITVDQAPDLSQVVRDVPAGEPSLTLLNYMSTNERMLTAMAGDNPYASGSPVDGIRFAREADAIAGMSGLTAANVSREHAAHWRRILQKFIATARIYDNSNLSLRWDGELDLVFGPDSESGPIGMYLPENADLVVREASTTYESRQDEVMRIRAMIADLSPFIGMFPGLAQKIVGSYLSAHGERDVDSYLETMQAAPL